MSTYQKALAIVANTGISESEKAYQLGALWWREIEGGAELMEIVLSHVAEHDIDALEEMFKDEAEDIPHD
jgi:hypothetical protein